MYGANAIHLDFLSDTKSVMINVKRSRKPLRLKDIFPEGVPKGRELKRLRRAFSSGFSRTKPWYKESESSLGASASAESDGLSGAPFVSTDLINGATSLINQAGDALANALVNIQFADTSHESKCFTIKTSGNLAQYEIDINGHKKGSNSIGEAQVNIHKLNNIVTGLDQLVADGFNTMSLSDNITGDSASQTFPYAVSSSSGSGVKDSIDYKIEVKAYVMGIKVYDETFKGSPVLSSPYANMDAITGSTINYDSTTTKASSGKYQFEDLVVSFMAIHGKSTGMMFLEALAIGGKKIKKNNPFTAIEKNVAKQLSSTDDYLIHQIESVVTSQLNSGSVKPPVDAAFEALYTVGWDKSTIQCQLDLNQFSTKWIYPVTMAGFLLAPFAELTSSWS